MSMPPMPKITRRIEILLDKDNDPVDDIKNASSKYVTLYDENGDMEDQYSVDIIDGIDQEFESKCPDCGEDVALSGDHGRADVGKKKKKIAKVPRGFEFKEAIDEHWESLIQEVRFKAFTHSSSFVGNVKYDQDEQSMEIILNGKTYEFCNVSERLYDSFEGANSKGAFFNREIKTLHDC